MATLKVVFLLAVSVMFTPSIASCFKLINSGQKLKHVSGSVNYMWGIDTGDRIYRCDRPCTGKWVNVAGGLKQIDVGEEEVWGVNSADDIFKRAADGSGGWKHIKGSLKHVSASGNGYIWGVNKADDIFKCKKPCNGKWSHVSGKLKQIDGGHTYVYGVNSNNDIFAKPVDDSAGWRHFPGKMEYVTASGNDDIFGIYKGKTYRCKKPCIGEWELMCGSLTQCDATFGALVGVDSDNKVYKHKLAV